MKRGPRSALLWTAAFVLTVVLAVFQRVTGPTYPLGVTVAVGEGSLGLRLPRAHGGDGGLRVAVPSTGLVTGGAVQWRRFPTEEPWRSEPLAADGDGRLEARIPHQPPAGKVEYRLRLETAAGARVVPADTSVVARFRGNVPAAVLVPHILAMFASMLLATRAVLRVLLEPSERLRGLVLGAMGLLMVGGLVLGPAVQVHAFGAWWTGWPLGSDLTDNKTLLAFVAWLPATVLVLAGRRARAATLLGWVVMMGVFLIPHSLAGSEVDWAAVAAPPPPAPAEVSPPR